MIMYNWKFELLNAKLNVLGIIRNSEKKNHGFVLTILLVYLVNYKLSYIYSAINIWWIILK